MKRVTVVASLVLGAVLLVLFAPQIWAWLIRLISHIVEMF